MNQAPLPKPSGGRRAALNSHAKALASGNPFLHQAAITHLTAMNPTDKEVNYVQKRAQKLSVAKNPRILPATRSGVGGPGVRGGGGLIKGIENIGKAGIKAGLNLDKTIYQAGAIPGEVRPYHESGAQQLQAQKNLVNDIVPYRDIMNIGKNPIAGGLGIASILPFGKAGRIVEEARLAEAGVKGAQEAGTGAKGFLAARQAAKAAKRIAPITDKAARDAHILELSNRAMEDPAVRDKVARYRHEATVNILEPVVPPHEFATTHDPVTGSYRVSSKTLYDTLPNDGKHLYHATDAGSLTRIAREGLRPGKVRPGEPHGAYFAEDGIGIWSLRPSRQRAADVILRAKKGVTKTQITDIFEPGSGFHEHVSPHTVPPQNLEYLGHDGQWHSLSDYAKGVTPETGGDVGAKIRQWLRPDFKGLGKYEKVGAKLDNPGAIEARKLQEELRAPARQARAAKLRAAQKQSFAAAKGSENPLRTAALSRGVLKGALPSVGVKGLALSKEEQLAALEHIDSLHMYTHDRDRLVNALADAADGKVPTPAEQTLMEKAFGRERITAPQAIRAGGLKDAALQIASIPRAVKASGDLSWGLRQGLLAAAYNPKEFGKAFAGTFKPAFSEAEAQARMAEIVHAPEFPYLVKMGVPFTEIGSAAHGVANISNKEEAIMSNWAEHLHELPGIRSVPGVKHAAQGVSKVVRASDRGYVVPLNELRLGLGTQLLHQALENGWSVEGKLGKDLGGLVGVLTGRGSLPKRLANYRATINALFFSPGLMSSRIHMLSPYYYARLDPFARQQALHAARNLTATLYMVLRAGQMAGAKVTWDPRNSDFGKLRFGNTRIDVAGGFSQYLTLASRLATQTTISSTSGKKTKLSSKFGGTSDYDVVTNFFANKLSPILSEGVAIAKQGRFGQPLTPTGELGNMFSPLLWNDMYQEATTKGPGTGPGMAAATFLPDLFGVGVQNYAPPKKKGRGSSSNSGNPYGGSSGGSSGNPYGGGSSSGSNPYGG